MKSENSFTPQPYISKLSTTQAVLLPMIFSLKKDIENNPRTLISTLRCLLDMEIALTRHADPFTKDARDPEFLKTTILPKAIQLQHKLRNTDPTLAEAAADVTDMQLAIWAYLQRRENNGP